MKGRVYVLALIIATCAASCVGQENAVCSAGMQANGSYGVDPKSGAPFQATARISFEQKLADGNTIRGFAIIHQARSTIGSTRNEVPQRCFFDADGTPKLAFSINTYDAAAKTSEYWAVFGDMVGWQDGVVHVQRSLGAGETAVTAVDVDHQRRQEAMERWSGTEYKSERLGSRVIAGIMVEGQRQTRTIPAGKAGNEQPLVLVHEAWFSAALGQQMLVIDDDPRAGKTTYEVETITLGEPDAAQFVPPASFARKGVRPM